MFQYINDTNSNGDFEPSVAINFSFKLHKIRLEALHNILKY